MTHLQHFLLLLDAIHVAQCRLGLALPGIRAPIRRIENTNVDANKM
jgi:hypothetical protein